MKRVKGYNFTSRLDCGHYPTATASDDIEQCMGFSEDGRSMCLSCCGAYDAEFMRDHRSVTLYYSNNDTHEELYTTGHRHVFPVYGRRAKVSQQAGFHGSVLRIATGRFKDMDGVWWSFQRRGDGNTARCIKLRRQPKSYEGQWGGYDIARSAGAANFVAWRGGELIATGPTLKDLKMAIKEAEKNEYDKKQLVAS
jgi:hypothetical protein